MSQYTEIMQDFAFSIDPMEEDYQEKLLEAAGQFRWFGEALTFFIFSHGFQGDAEDSEEKAQFIKDKLKGAGIPRPREISSWFTENRTVSRKTAFQICFAFDLDVKETNEFFRTVQLERSFDCHDVDEAVYYYCIRNHLKYSDAERILGQIARVKKTGKIPEKDVLYTSSIVEYIDHIDEENLLIRYINDHIESFRYHNAKAVSFVKKLWSDISGPDGLAVQEGKLINQMLNSFHSDSGKKTGVNRKSGEEGDVIFSREYDFSKDEYIVAERDEHAVWTICLQIMGLNKGQVQFCQSLRDRSLTPVLEDNILLPLRADKCFPSRQAIEKMTAGKKADYETVRKLIIFLVFYTFWAKKIIDSGDVYYFASPQDGLRCLSLIDKYLVDAGYPEMYYGNPYDWIFMWSLNDDQPLMAFRMYILEVFDVGKTKNEDTAEEPADR